MKKEALLSIAAGDSQLLLITIAKQLGFSIIAIDRNPDSSGFKIVDEAIILSTHDAKPIIDILKRRFNNYNIIGILNRSSGIPVLTTAILTSGLNLNSYSVEAAETIISKHKLIEFCQNNGIKVPFTKIIHKGDKRDLNEIFPAIIKPSLSLIGKSGISLVNNPIEFETSINKAFDATINDTILFQEYIDGVDIAMVSFVQNKSLYPVCFIEEINRFNKDQEIKGVGVLIPARITKKIEAEIIKISELIVKELGIITSPFMISFRIKKDIPYLIEIHLDFGGDLILDALLPNSLDINVVELGIRFMANENINKMPEINIDPCAILYESGEELNNTRKYHIIKDEMSNIDNVVKQFEKKYEQFY